VKQQCAAIREQTDAREQKCPVILERWAAKNVMKNRPTNRIDEEWVSVDCLAHYLKNICRCGAVQVQKVTDDPPDFWITVNGATFAAEVTSIVTDAGYRARSMALKDVIKRSMSEDIGNRGTYALLTMRQPELPRRNTREWNSLVAESLAFIRDTREIPSTDQHPLIKTKNGPASIDKDQEWTAEYPKTRK